MSAPLDRLSWPAHKLPDALAALGRALEVEGPAGATATPPAGDDPGRLGPWLDGLAARAGLELTPLGCPHAEVPERLLGGIPALIALPGLDGARSFLVVATARGDDVVLLDPGGGSHRLARDQIATALFGPAERAAADEVERLLGEVGVAPGRRVRARRALLRERLRSAWFGGGWLVGLPPGASARTQARAAGLGGKIALALAAYVTQVILWLSSWWLIGGTVLAGRLDQAWLAAWALLLLSLVPLRLTAARAAGSFAIAAGGLLKMRLLAGTLRLEPEEVRGEGAGQLLGRVVEGEAVETLALSGGMLTALAALELVAALAILGAGAGRVSAVLLVAWVALALGLVLREHRRRRTWSRARLDLTHDLVERLVGHRTRLAQEDPARWHEEEDRALARYTRLGRDMDRTGALLLGLLPAGWLLLGLAGLLVPWVMGEGEGEGGAGAIALGLGGLLLAHAALLRLATGLDKLTGAAIAWEQAAPLFHAAARPEIHGSAAAAAEPAVTASADGGQPVLLEAIDLTFRHRGRQAPILDGASLTLGAGDRVLLEGPSGGGKSTLLGLLSGLRLPERGLLLLGGLDLRSLGSAAWRRRVAAAPQFHDNHVLTGTLAFNLLLGRRWPPTPQDLAEAGGLCRELGLGPLLARMPGGLLQVVGETGWQLSHGERSRLYLARALLQQADLVLLDESFAALDPETLRLALGCALGRAPALLVVAHP